MSDAGAVHPAHGLHGSVHFAEHAARVTQECFADWQQCHALGASREQGSAELVLQLADLAAQRGLRDVQPERGAADGSLFGDGDDTVFSLTPVLSATRWAVVG